MPVLRRVAVNGTELNVAIDGSGPAVLLLHGFPPHTWELWTDIMAGLSDRYRVIAPDLRGFGASGPATSGYDAANLAEDAAALLTELGESAASVVGIDAGGRRRPSSSPSVTPTRPAPRRHGIRTGRAARRRGLPGRRPPWWFGFHAAEPRLAETVLEGHEAAYIDWFLRTGTLGDGVPSAIRDAFVRAYTATGALSRAFSYYRALPDSALQIAQAITTTRLTVPTMAVGAQPVGTALERQLRSVTDELTGHVIEDCGHIIPLHRPHALLELLNPFLAGERTSTS